MFDFRGIKEFLKGIALYAIIFISVLIVVVYVFSFQIVIGDSMNPKYKDNNVLILSKINYRIFKVNRFDILSLKWNNQIVVKRVIGLPNEKIEYKNNNLYVNDELINYNFETLGNIKDFVITLKDDEYYVVGDNRKDSIDSRNFGPINKKDIVGKTIFKIW